MSLKNVKLNIIQYVAVSLLALSGFALAEEASQADTSASTATATSNTSQQSDDAFSCANAADVDACLKQQTQAQNQSSNPPTSISSSQFLNIDSPVSVSVKYDPNLSLLLGLDYSHAFLNSAIGVKLDAGQNEIRANLTLAHAFSDKQQAKITYEYLTQRMTFNFDTGDVTKWVGQNALGGDYRYILDKGILHSVDVAASYIKANSQDLSPVSQTVKDPAGGYQTKTDYRRIAGGTETGAMLKLTAMPFESTAVTVGGGYSSLTYDTKYNTDSQDNKTVAYSAAVNQLITPKTLLELGTDHSAATTANKLAVKRLLPHQLEASISGEYDIGQGDLSDVKSVMVGLSYPAPKEYTLKKDDTLSRIADWVKTPAVYATQVYAIKDEKVVTSTLDPSDKALTSTAILGAEMSPVSTKDMFDISTDGYDKVDYVIINPDKIPYTAKTASGSSTGTVSIDNLKVSLQTDTSDPNYFDILGSSSSMPAAALDSDETQRVYTITVSAQGWKGGLKIGPPVSQAVALTVKPAAGKLEWKAGSSLPDAAGGETYYPTSDGKGFSLLGLIDNPNSSQTYSFVFTSGQAKPPAWLEISKDSEGNPILTGTGETVSDSAEAIPIFLTVTNEYTKESISSGSTAGDPNYYNIEITNQATTWNSDAKLPNATPNATEYDGADGYSLLKLLENPNSADTYSFSFATATGQSPYDWLTIGKDGKGSLTMLVGTGSKLPDSSDPIPINLTVTNVSAGGDAIPGPNYVINMDSQAPQWVKASDSNLATVVIADSQATTVNLNTPDYVKYCGDGCTFKFSGEQQPTWLDWNDTSNPTQLVINSNEIPASVFGSSPSSDLIKVSVSLIAINSVEQESAPQEFTITVSHNPAITVTATGKGWASQPQVGSQFSQNVSSFFESSYMNGETALDELILTGFSSSPNASSWLTQEGTNSSTISGMPNKSDLMVSTIKLTVFSQAAGKSYTITVNQPLVVSLVISPSSTSGAGVAYIYLDPYSANTVYTVPLTGLPGNTTFSVKTTVTPIYPNSLYSLFYSEAEMEPNPPPEAPYSSNLVVTGGSETGGLPGPYDVKTGSEGTVSILTYYYLNNNVEPAEVTELTLTPK